MYVHICLKKQVMGTSGGIYQNSDGSFVDFSLLKLSNIPEDEVLYAATVSNKDDCDCYTI